MRQHVAIFGWLDKLPQLLLVRDAAGFRLPQASENPFPRLALRRDEEYAGEDATLVWGWVAEAATAQPGSGSWHRWDQLPAALGDAEVIAAALRKVTRLGGRQWVCTIVGCKEQSSRYTEAVARDAFAAGRLAATLGFAVLTGGLGGVMSDAAAGAASVHGMTVGILPGDCHADANPHLRLVLPSGIGYARNYLTAVAADLMIALPGGTGTLEEICFAVDFGRPVLSWGSWDLPELIRVPAGDLAALKRELVAVMNHKFQKRTEDLNHDRNQDRDHDRPRRG